MTTATTEGRRLVLTVDGIDEAFLVDPISARRGKALTDLFLDLSMQKASPDLGEAIFIESLGPMNYSRATGLVVVLASEDAVLATWNHGDPEHAPDPRLIGSRGTRLYTRMPLDDEPEPLGENIRQGETEALALCAFYWQTVVGIEAVNAFIEAGEDTAASLKALTLLLTRTGHLISRRSSETGTESATQQGTSSATSATEGSSATVRLPARGPGYRPKTGKRAKQSRK